MLPEIKVTTKLEKTLYNCSSFLYESENEVLKWHQKKCACIMIVFILYFYTFFFI